LIFHNSLSAKWKFLPAFPAAYALGEVSSGAMASADAASAIRALRVIATLPADLEG